MLLASEANRTRGTQRVSGEPDISQSSISSLSWSRQKQPELPKSPSRYKNIEKLLPTLVLFGADESFN